MNAYDPQNEVTLVHHVAINDNKTTCNLLTKDLDGSTIYSRNWGNVTCDDCKKAGHWKNGSRSTCSAYLDEPGGRMHCVNQSGHEGPHWSSDAQASFGVFPKPSTDGSRVVPTDQAKRVHHLMSIWFDEFLKKNQDYQTSTGNVSENFGLMGQYMKLTDKIHKLRTPMWDDEILRQAGKEGIVKELNFEGAEEILRDIIGHCFLALDFMEQRDER